MTHHQSESLCIYCSLSPRESLSLGSIVRTRFQFIRLTLVAVEVNDLLGLIAFFGHSASPSETFRIELAFWLANAEAPASQVASASSYCFSEYVGILAIVLAKPKLIQVRQPRSAAIVLEAANS